MLYMTRTHGFYSIYTNIQWNNCHFPTELVQMFHLVNVWNFATIHHLLQCPPNLFQQDGAPAHRSRHTVAYLRLNVPEFFEPENWPPNSPDLNPVDYTVWGHCSRWCIVAKFQHWPVETCAYRLLGSAKPGHIKSSDRSAAKKTDYGHQGKGCPRGVSSGLTLWENDSCFTVC